MSQTRRVFLGAGVTFAAASALGAVARAAQGQGQTGSIPVTPFPTEGVGGPLPSPRLNRTNVMKANQDQVKKSVARLAELVGELQKDLEANDTKNVLSLGMIRKTEEIEKLARQVRSLIRG
jgi:hypothetical protein